MLLNIGGARNWKPLTEEQARTFLIHAYNFLGGLPIHLELVEVYIEPQWTVSQGHFEICGVSGSITFGTHRIIFAYGNIPTRNTLRVTHNKEDGTGSRCPSFGSRVTWKGPNTFFPRMCSTLRTTLEEDLGDPECGNYAQRNRMNGLLSAPAIRNAQIIKKGRLVGD